MSRFTIRIPIRFRDVDSLKIEEVWVNVYHGGETPVPNEDIHLYLDNLVIARQPIGPLPVTRVSFLHYWRGRFCCPLSALPSGESS